MTNCWKKFKITMAENNFKELGPVLGLIPAKRCSTRLPEKNIRVLAGKPLLGWTVDAAKASGVMDRLVVSTEDEYVAKVARDCGAEVPFMRPAELARDPAGVVQVALHALQAMRELGAEFKTLIILLPTSPFRNGDDIRDALKLFRDKKGKFLMSVGPYPHPPFAAMDLREDGLLQPFFPQYITKKSQEMPKAWRANGALHILDVATFEREKSYYAQPLIGFPMTREKSADIDSAEDWSDAESHLAHLKKSGQ
jgi:CMP-N-acetylneuraminic acid synthetase